MSEQKTYLLVNTIPNMADMASFQLYLSRIVPIFMQFGGQGLGRYRTVEQIMGKGGIKASAVFEFPNAQAIKEMVASKEFNDLNELRQKAYAQEVDLMICEAL